MSGGERPRGQTEVPWVCSPGKEVRGDVEVSPAWSDRGWRAGVELVLEERVLSKPRGCGSMKRLNWKGELGLVVYIGIW